MNSGKAEEMCGKLAQQQIENIITVIMTIAIIAMIMILFIGKHILFAKLTYWENKVTGVTLFSANKAHTIDGFPRGGRVRAVDTRF